VTFRPYTVEMRQSRAPIIVAYEVVLGSASLRFRPVSEGHCSSKCREPFDPSRRINYARKAQISSLDRGQHVATLVLWREGVELSSTDSNMENLTTCQYYTTAKSPKMYTPCHGYLSDCNNNFVHVFLLQP
jgi:hypothetical protein